MKSKPEYYDYASENADDIHFIARKKICGRFTLWLLVIAFSLFVIPVLEVALSGEHLARLSLF
jgi:hypothetical protein